MWAQTTENSVFLPTASSQSGNMAVWEEGIGGLYQAAVFFAYVQNFLTPLQITQATEKLLSGFQTESLKNVTAIPQSSVEDCTVIKKKD